MLEDGSISSGVSQVLDKWKNEFSNILNKRYESADYSCIFSCQNNNQNVINDILNCGITVEEVKTAIFNAKQGKASGFDNIPIDIFRNNCSISFLHILFSVCFTTGFIPSDWGKIVITPIPKSGSTDPRDPLSYRGIALSCSMFKIYCSILNKRLSTWAENNTVLAEEQNGFRKHRSTIDHVTTLSNVIDTRKNVVSPHSVHLLITERLMTLLIGVCCGKSFLM